MDFDRFEEVHQQTLTSIPAADLDGATGQYWGEQGSFEGSFLYDIDTVVDRDELAVMLWAEHHWSVYFKSTATADTTVRGTAEVSASPQRQVATAHSAASASGADMSDNADFTVEVQSGAAVDTVDIIGRLLNAEGHGPFSDGASGVGGSGDVGVDSWEGRPVGAPTFDARDEIYLNGLFETSNPADLSVGADLTVHHVYGVIEDFFN